MLKTFRPTNLPQYLLSNNRVTRNFACTPTALDGSKISLLSLLIESINNLIKSTGPLSLFNTEDLCLLTVNPIVNNRNWELTRLTVPSNHLDNLPLLVALMTKELSKLGANRIVIRIKENRNLAKLLKQSGFKLSHTESLYEGRSLKSDEVDIDVREKSDTDDLALFRLYNKATPVKVRSLSCPTLADWKDINGQYKNIATEYTIMKNSEARAYLKTYRSKRTQIVTLMVHPEYNYNIVKHLLQFSLTILTDIDEVKVYIPDFQVSTHKAALAIDLFKSASYEIYLLPITASQKLAVEETAIGFVT